MISRSLMIDTDSENLKSFLHMIGISDRNMQKYGDDAEFISGGENGALISETKGDFTYAVDIFLFSVDETALLDAITASARQGMLIAMPDEEAEDPDAVLAWSADGHFHGRLLEATNGFMLLPVTKPQA